MPTQRLEEKTVEERVGEGGGGRDRTHAGDKERSLYLNVRKPREILQDWGTLGSSVVWASGPGYPVPRAAKVDSARCHAVQHQTAALQPPTGVFAALSEPSAQTDARLGLLAAHGAEARKVNPKALVPGSLHLSRLRGCRAGLVESSRKNLVLGTPKAGQ